VNGDRRKSESIPLAKFEEELLLLQALSFRERVALQEKTRRLKQLIVHPYVLYQEIEDEEKAFQAMELGQSLWQTVVAKLKIHSLSTDMAQLQQPCQELGAVVTLYSDHNPLWTNQTGFEGSSESTTEPVLAEVQTDFMSELDQLNLKEDRSENGAKERHGVELMTFLLVCCAISWQLRGYGGMAAPGLKIKSDYIKASILCFFFLDASQHRD
jgi:hypothetical protein